MREIRIFNSKDELYNAAADVFAASAAAAIAGGGRFTAALAGGSTPEALFRLLASDRYKNAVDWGRVFLFFGDERMVPADSAESNYRMAAESLIKPAGIADGNVFRWKTELGLDQAAEEYERAVAGLFDLDAADRRPDREWPQFDLVLLGMGTDGHAASLFPHSPALSEISRFAVPNKIAGSESERLTLTYPVINNSSLVMFLVAGSSKADVAKEVLEGEFRPDVLPAQLVQPVNGRLLWLLDEAAGALLKR